jgi:hypothetical protein
MALRFSTKQIELSSKVKQLLTGEFCVRNQ